MRERINERELATIKIARALKRLGHASNGFQSERRDVLRSAPLLIGDDVLADELRLGQGRRIGA